MKRILILLVACILAVSGCGIQNEKEESLVTKSISELSAASILVEEKDGSEKSKDDGEVELVVEMPDYVKLMEKAYQTDDPEEYLKKILISGDYETKKIDTTATVTREEGERVVHEQEAVDQLLEQEVIKAMNEMIEVREK